MTPTINPAVARLADWLDAKFRRHGEIEDKEAADMLRALAKQDAAPTSISPSRLAINPTHEAADAFWTYWRENGETHKHGYYESTWGAINSALRSAGIREHDYGAAPTSAVPAGFWLAPMEPDETMRFKGALDTTIRPSTAGAIYADMRDSWIARNPGASAVTDGDPTCPRS